MPLYKVEDMSCGHCVAAIETAVKETDPSATVTADLKTKIVEVGSSADPAAIQSALEAIGYDAQPVNG